MKRLCLINTQKVFRLALTISFIMGHLIMLAQNGSGTIRGTVKTRDGKPAEFVNVTIEGGKSAQVDTKGKYFLKDLKPGSYTLIASYVGLGEQKREIVLKEGENQIQDFIISESNQQLEEVVINGGRTNKFSVKKTTTSAKMPLSNLENPQILGKKIWYWM